MDNYFIYLLVLISSILAIWDSVTLVVDSFSYIMWVSRLGVAKQMTRTLIVVGPIFVIVGFWRCFVLCPLRTYVIYGYVCHVYVDLIAM